MKFLLFNGSIHPQGNTFTALNEMAKVFHSQGVETEILHIGGEPVRDCIACGWCAGKGKCVFNDDVVNEWIEKAHHADGFVFATPVYYANASGRLQSAMNRMFYAGRSAFAQKVGAGVAVARCAGTVSAVDSINKYLLFSGMVVPGSSYWNIAYGRIEQECAQDLEGMQTMRNLASNMIWIAKCINLGKEHNILPPKFETGEKTHFIRKIEQK